MYSTFKDVEKLLVRPPKVKDPRPDNFVFRLHYQYTFTVLIVSSILVTSYSYIDKKGGWTPEAYLVAFTLKTLLRHIYLSWVNACSY